LAGPVAGGSYRVGYNLFRGMAVEVKTRESQFAAICGKDWPGLLVLAFSFPSEGAQIGVHYALMRERLLYRVYDGTGSQLHIVISKADETRLREIVAEFGGVERVPQMGGVANVKRGR